LNTKYSITRLKPGGIAKKKMHFSVQCTNSCVSYGYRNKILITCFNEMVLKMDTVFALCAIRAVFYRYIAWMKQLTMSLVSKIRKVRKRNKRELPNNRKTLETWKTAHEAYHLQLIAYIFRVVNVGKFLMQMSRHIPHAWYPSQSDAEGTSLLGP